ncbi:MAG: ATP-binding protein [Planctomycetia bacterium]|nr:ATP-binding protein [Planctomycetia bacterium]
MAQVIADAYGTLAADGTSQPPKAQTIPVDALVDEGETTTIEFKSTLRINLHTGEKDPRMELAILRTVAGFLNKDGGTLIVGVSDDGTPVGIEADKFENEDKMCLHLMNIINSRIGPQHTMYIHPRFDDYEDVRALVVECKKGKTAVFVKDGNAERFYIRTGTSTAELSGSQTQEYIKHRFQ